jgi:hypothetical protein
LALKAAEVYFLLLIIFAAFGFEIISPADRQAKQQIYFIILRARGREPNGIRP